MSDNGHILVVDDQKEICDVVQEYLTGEGYRVSTASDGGGMTGKGTSRGIVLHRRDATGKVKESGASLDEDVRDQDVIYVKESVF